MGLTAELTGLLEGSNRALLILPSAGASVPSFPLDKKIKNKIFGFRAHSPVREAVVCNIQSFIIFWTVSIMNRICSYLSTLIRLDYAACIAPNSQ